MEDIGPEASKRPRLDSFGGAPPMHRMHQQHSESPLPLHTYQGQALRPPSAYSQPLPPSPYDPTHDHRNLPEGPPHAYPSQHSGYNTPVQTSRPYQPDAVYSRQGSHSAPTRSPDEGQPITGLRPINTASGNDGQHYAQHPHPDPSNHPAGPPIAYGASEGYVNGNTHGLPMATPHDPSHRPPPVQQYAGYSESPLGNAPGPYSAGYGPAPQDWRSIQHGQRKNTRALQVRSEPPSMCSLASTDPVSPASFRHVIPAVLERPNATKANRSVAIVGTTTSSAGTRKLHHQST